MRKHDRHFDRFRFAWMLPAAILGMTAALACGPAESNGPAPASTVRAAVTQSVVLRGEQRAVGVRVSIHLPGSSDTLSRAWTNARGEVSFQGLEPGTYDVSVEAPVGWRTDAGPSARKSVTAPGEGTADIGFRLVPADSVTDIDGNAYRTVRVGGQTWMAENLVVTRFRNGDPVPQAASDEEWGSARTSGSPAWSHYDNDPAATDRYGRHYNEFAATDPRGICPQGWRVPTDQDWFELESAMGVHADSLTFEGWRPARAGELRSRRTEPADPPRWDTPNEGSSNITGFSAVPNGYRVGKPQAVAQTEGDFWRQGASSTFWSATPKQGSDETWAREIQSGREEIYRKGIFGYGVGIRCVEG